MDDKSLTILANALAKELTIVMGITVSGSLQINTKQIILKGNDINKVKGLSLKLNFFSPQNIPDSQTGYPLDRNTMRITDIEVVPKGQGYGSKVVKALLKIATKTIEIYRVILFAEGDGVKGFWEKMKFTPQSSERPLSMHKNIRTNFFNKIKKLIKKLCNTEN